jgi:hypothetical protein
VIPQYGGNFGLRTNVLGVHAGTWGRGQFVSAAMSTRSSRQILRNAHNPRGDINAWSFNWPR